MLPTPSITLASGLFAAVLLFAPQARAQEAQSLFHQAYYLENEEGRLEEALQLYRQVAESRRAGADVRALAEERAAGIAEEFAAAEFSRLVPAETILFAQLDRPGEQLADLLDQLGLLGTAHQVAGEGFAVSPLLIDYAVGLRGLAVAVTEIDPGGEPGGVLLLHPGRHEGLRGLVETGLPAAGQRVDTVGGFPVWSIEGEAFVCLTRRLVIASRDRHHIAGVVERLAGAGGSSLADDEKFARTFQPGGSGLLSFYVNAEPLKPMIRMAMEREAGQDPGAAMAIQMLDLESLESLSGRLGVVDDGLAFDLALDLREGHRNVVFNLMRRPALGRDTLELVPHGAAFFAATAFNPESEVAPIARDDARQPVVTMLDFGRELFGNVIDVAIYGVPSKGGAAGGLPNVAVVMRVNDPERSLALWELGLGMASQATGGGAPDSELFGDTDVWIYRVQGVPIYLAGEDGRVVISTQLSSVEHALRGSGGKSVLSDPVYAPSLDILDASPTGLIAACPGRVGKMVLPFIEPEEAAEMKPILKLFGETSVTLAAQHSNTRFALSARVRNLPDVSGLVAQAIAEGRRGHTASANPWGQGGYAAEAVAKKSAASGDLKSMSREFDLLVQAGDPEAAAHLAERMVATVDDAKGLNNIAWALLTEERYAGDYDDVARSISQRSNELSHNSNWYFLDTLALAEFRTGHVEEAVELQTRVVELAEDDGADTTEVRESLKRYRAELKELGDPIVQSGDR